MGVAGGRFHPETSLLCLTTSGFVYELCWGLGDECGLPTLELRLEVSIQFSVGCNQRPQPRIIRIMHVRSESPVQAVPCYRGLQEEVS